MYGSKIQTIERRGKYELCCYGSSGWAVFEYRPTKPDEPEWKSVINGKFCDVWEKYVDLTMKQN